MSTPLPRPPIVNRRFFLRAAGFTIALPLLESLSTKVLGAGLAVGSKAGTPIGATRPTRMVAVGNMFGFYPGEFFPKTVGRDYTLPILLQPLAAHQNDMTVFSGLDHGLKGGHYTVHSFLSGVRTVDAKGMPEGNISMDQRAAETIGGATRFASLTVGPEDGPTGGCQMSWTRSGTRVPPITGPRELFQKLFVNENASDKAHAGKRFALQGSMLDAVNGDAKSLNRHLDKRDQEKLDEYFTSLRDVEKQLELSQRWANVPKPVPGMKEPVNTNLVQDLPVLYDLIALALQTDSTRIAALEIGPGFEGGPLGVKKGYHALSHHGQVQETIDILLKLERYQTEQFGRFLTKLKSIEDGDRTLFDHTTVIFGSGMGNANAHTNTNLPVILAGGGYRHGEYRAYPDKGLGRVPLCNLYLSLLHRFGVETNRFGLSTGTMRDLELARA